MYRPLSARCTLHAASSATIEDNFVKGKHVFIEAHALSTMSKKVLVVDDDPDIRATMREILEDEGYAVMDAENGLAALGRLRSGDSPDLILLDLSMPVMSGPEFRHEQRRDPALSSIPVVVVTAVGGLASKVAPLEAADVLQKPVQLDDLLGTVKRHCR